MRIRSQPCPITSCSLFDGCRPKDLAGVESLVTDIAVQAGMILSREQVTRPQFVIVHAGRVELSRDGQHIATVTAGSWFGDAALLAHAEVESVTAVATEPTRVWVCSRREFTSLLQQLPLVRERLSTAAGHLTLARSVPPVTAKTDTSRDTAPPGRVAATR